MIAAPPAFAASAWQNLADPVFVRPDMRELPEAAVMTLAQDRTGFLWVGTQGGLARFDGYHFRSFLAHASDPKALHDGYTRTILPDADGGP
jgi:ligand-binding sensor domain-containing protein